MKLDRTKVLNQIDLKKSCLVFLSICSLSACEVTSKQDSNLINPKSFVPETQAEAGLVTVSTSTILPWSEVSDSLKPRFEASSAQQLLASVLPITSSQFNGISDRTSTGLTVGLPGTLLSNSTTKTQNRELAGDGTITETSTSNVNETSERTSGTVTEPVLRSFEIATPDTSKSTAITGLDPFLQYRTATALFQEIQMLNNYLNRSFVKGDRVPFLFRSQINIQPNARNMAIDTFVEIAVVQPNQEGLRPIVVPLIITDNLERASAQRLEQAVRDLRFKLSGLVGQVGIGAGTEALKEEIAKLDAIDFNSLITVAVTDIDELTVRIGAQRSSTGVAAVARSYDVTYLVLWPKDGCDTVKCGGEINYFTHMRNSATGQRLPITSIEFQNTLIERLLNVMITRGASEKDLEYAEDELPSAIKKNSKAVYIAMNGGEDLEESNWNYDAEVHQIVSGYFDNLNRRLSEIEFELPELKLPGISTAIIRDSGSGIANITLPNQTSLPNLVDIEAQLIIEEQKNEFIRLGALMISQDSNGLLTFQFPSTSALGLREQLLAKNANLVLNIKGATGQMNLFVEKEIIAPGVVTRSYPVRLDKIFGRIPIPRLFSGYLFPNTPKVSDSTTKVRLVVNAKACPKGAECPGIKNLKVSVGQFPVTEVKIDGTVEASFSSVKNSFIATVGKAYEMTLGSMDSGSKATVVLQAIDAQGKPVNGQDVQSLTITAK